MQNECKLFPTRFGLLLGALTAIVAAGLAVFSFQSQLRAQPAKPVFLEVLSRLDVKSELAERGFQNQSPTKLSANGDHLLIAAAASVNGLDGVLIGSDMEGNIGWTTPVKEAVLDVAVNEQGAVAALVEEGPDLTITLRQFDEKGKNRGDGHAYPDVFRLLFAGSNLYGLTRTGFLRELTDNTRDGGRQAFASGIVLPSGDTYVHALPAGRMRVIDGKNATWSENSARSPGRAASLPAPIQNRGVEKAKALYTRKGTASGIIIQAAAGERSGRSYLLLTGFTPEEGAPVIVMDSAGAVTEELRLDVRYGGSSDVMPFPISLAAGGNKLAVLDSLGVVTIFRLP